MIQDQSGVWSFWSAQLPLQPFALIFRTLQVQHTLRQDDGRRSSPEEQGDVRHQEVIQHRG